MSTTRVIQALTPQGGRALARGLMFILQELVVELIHYPFGMLLSKEKKALCCWFDACACILVLARRAFPRPISMEQGSPCRLLNVYRRGFEAGCPEEGPIEVDGQAGIVITPTDEAWIEALVASCPFKGIQNLDEVGPGW